MKRRTSSSTQRKTDRYFRRSVSDDRVRTAPFAKRADAKPSRWIIERQSKTRSWQNERGRMQDKSMPALLKRLIAVMKSALAESSEVVQIIEDIETCGFKVMVVVDAIIQPFEQPLWSSTPSYPASDPNLELSTEDLSWLKSLRIVPNPDQPNSPFS